ncbi:MAG: class I SAM-dependent methyltransferase, partial [Xanthobacteraceae bacterium]
MDHLKRITDEFTRQAETFEVWAVNVDAGVGERFGGALGEAARGRLIDVACGPGVVTAALAPKAASIVGFDATEEMLGKARTRCTKAGLRNVEFKTGDAEHLPFADATFDGAVTRAALHHFA